MAILTWSEQFNLGLPSIDEQHRRLVEILNQLDEAVAIGDEPNTLLGLIAALVDYSRYHFSHEEQLMEQAGYDSRHVAAHKFQHQQFISRVAREQEKAVHDPDAVSNALLEFLVEWLSEHILVADKQMVLAIGQQGPRTEETLRSEQTEIMRSNLYSALRESETRFKQLADLLPALIWLTNVKQEPVFCNRFWLSTFDIPREQLCKEQWLAAIDPLDIAKLEAVYGKVAAEGSAQMLEYRVLRPNKEPLWVLETVVPRLRKNGHLAGLMGCGMDISPLKQAKQRLEQQVAERTRDLLAANKTLAYEKKQQMDLNRQLKDMQSHLIQSEKMASIGQLAAGVAHEINNPLAYISSDLATLRQYLQELLQATDLAEQMVELVPAEHPSAVAFKAIQQSGNIEFLKQDLPDLINEALDGVKRAKQIIENLKDFSRIDHQERGSYDLEAGIEATLNIVNTTLKTKAGIVKQFAGVGSIECVGGQINQVIMGLLINAAQAIDGTGVITIRTGCTDDDGVWFEVEDNGIGIPDEIKSRIFDPFFTTKPVGTGPGLGLSMAYTIIQDHKGRIELHSAPGQGSRFKVFLPR